MFINEDEEEESDDVRPQRKVQPAFYERANQAAYKSAIRSTYEESNTFFVVDEPPITNRITDLGMNMGAIGRKMRGHGNLVAYAKRVTADLDSDDELIMQMKEKGYSDQQIADRLKREGRTKYDRKSISTRVGRIKWAQAARVDEMMIEGYKEWQFEDVCDFHYQPTRNAITN